LNQITISRQDLHLGLQRVNPARGRKDPQLNHIALDTLTPTTIRLAASDRKLEAQAIVPMQSDIYTPIRFAIPGDLLVEFVKQADDGDLLLEVDTDNQTVTVVMGQSRYGFDAIFDFPFPYSDDDLREAGPTVTYEVEELVRAVTFTTAFIDPTSGSPHQTVSEQRDDQMLAGNSSRIGIYQRTGFTGNIRLGFDGAQGLLTWLKTLPHTQVTMADSPFRTYAIASTPEGETTRFNWMKPVVGVPKIEDKILATPVQFRFSVDRPTLERLVKRLSLLLPKGKDDHDRQKGVRMTFDPLSEPGTMLITVKNDRGRASVERLLAVGDGGKQQTFSLNYKNLLDVSALFHDQTMEVAVTDLFLILTESKDDAKRIGIIAKL
jgi:DNA polymerase III sliding clamp (beta) subunit (PCNA family)